MSGLPDGASSADYAYLHDSDRAGLMWEWLRRDAAYVSWYVRASAVTCGDPPVALRWRLLLAEDPAVTARHARLFWRADLDPGALRVIARPAVSRDPAGWSFHHLRRFLSLICDAEGREHAVLSDGQHHIRLDVEEGTLAEGPVTLHYLLDRGRDADRQLETVRRLAALRADRRFSNERFPLDPHSPRNALVLRVHDALRGGATQRDIAQILVGPERVQGEWHGRSDALRSRVRRLVGEARRLAAGGYRRLLQRDERG